jgi:4-hydroxy-3-polyprenylbenzoate decarboxylase
MAYSALADFLEELAACGQLARVGVEVDANLEIAEITRRVARAGGPALLFERVGGQSAAVVTNLLGSEARVCKALGIDSLDSIAARIESLIDEHTPRNWFERLKSGGDLTGADKFRAKLVKSGACQQVVRLGRDVELAALPLLKQWPGESGPVLTGGLLVTQARGSEHRWATLSPLVALGENRLAVVDDGGSEFARIWADYRRAGEKMTAAVVVGGDPATSVAASIDLPPGADFYHVTGLVRGKALEVVKCRTHALEVPAEADMILEGYLDPQTAEAVVVAAARASRHRVERPAGVLHVTAITQRTHPIVPARIDTGEHGEAGALLKARERVLLPAVRTLAPGVVDLHLPALGGLHRFAFVSLAKTYPFEARQVASALWGSAALRFTKFLMLVDADVNVRDIEAVLAEVGANASPQRDVFSYDGPTPDGVISGLSRHVGIDATTKIPGEQGGPAAERLIASSEVQQLVTSRWNEYGLL